MKKVKIGFWVILILFIGLVIFQNQNFFFNTKHHLNINLLFDKFHTPDWNLGVFFLICFIAGVFVSLFFAFLGKIKTNKLIKSLKQTINSKQEEIDTLKNELTAIKGVSEPSPKADPEESKEASIGEIQEEPIEQPQDETPDEAHKEETVEASEDKESVENKETAEATGEKTAT
jgi:predicted membrane protein